MPKWASAKFVLHRLCSRSVHDKTVYYLNWISPEEKLGMRYDRLCCAGICATLLWGGQAVGADWLITESGCRVSNADPQVNETVSWSGSCTGGLANGTGTAVWEFDLDGNRVSRRYVGAMRNGNVHGEGVMEFANGDRYEGAWQNNFTHGRGTYYWSDGDRAEGAWENDRLIEGRCFDTAGDRSFLCRQNSAGEWTFAQ